MALGFRALPLTFLAHALAIAGAVMVLVWVLYYRGGMAWEAANKNLIFNALEHFKRDCRRMPAVFHDSWHFSYKSLPLKKEVKKVVHLVLHAIAIILGCVGIAAAFKNHNESNIANLYSLHSWLGITIISLYGIQWIYGFLVFFYPKGSPTLRSECLPWHVLFGIFVYILAVGNAALGFLEKLTFLESSGIAKYGPEALLVNFTAVVTVLYGAFVILSVLGQAPIEDDDSYSAI
ncbi:hypothetical protein POTOM_051023 [Populus tomentosa]|uniref:ascorbate ferrireductase (transmembrane) n=1 Tax=Populus tomentosa TaxID=118781 RepID=A0A8X7Y4S9_POPTO|nr:hypothetical protein POTOM_051023 [Populus tomentosa]